jgi:predicted dehydrogenase
MQHLSEVRFGFIGAGQIAHWAADCLKRHPHAKLVATQDLHEQRVKDLAGKHGVKYVFTKEEEMLAHEEVDAVYIATPNKFHAPMAIKALEAGKHVMLEKPFAMSTAEAEAVIVAAKKAGKVVTVGMNQRFTADSQKIKKLVQDGTLGEIYHAKAMWFRRSGIPKFGTWFVSKELAGGGSLYDIGVHMLDLCLWVIDNFKPVSVMGATYTKFGNRGLGEGGWGMSDRGDVKFDVDDFSAALIRFENGATVTLDTSWACHRESGSRENVELFGTEAGAYLRPARLFRAVKGEPGGYETLDQLDVPLMMPHQDRLHNFVNHLRGEEELCVTSDQALAVQKILDGIAESNRTGNEVKIH